MLSPGIALGICLALPTEPSVVLAYEPVFWRPDGGDATWSQPIPPSVITNGFYIARPSAQQDMHAWRADMQKLRDDLRSPQRSLIRVEYRGVRAWVRLHPNLGPAICLRPGDRIKIAVEARWLDGNRTVCAAWDFLDDRSQWRGWSGVVATAQLSEDGAWHRFELETTVPTPPAGTRPNLIIGQDATHDPTPARWEVRRIDLELPRHSVQTATLGRLRDELRSAAGTPDLYDRSDLGWGAANYSCYFLFLYDESVYDRAAGRWRVPELVSDWIERFGGVDSVVLWHAYPRIGVDNRNQFDFFRDLPGGLSGVRRFVRALQSYGVRVFIPYKPWDTGTRREIVEDATSVARMVRALNADGVFLDTMQEAPSRLRHCVDRLRKGVLFEPEGVPPLEQLYACSSSWAQYVPELPEPGLPLLKWVNPRHMQHYIRRWESRHAEEIRAAYLCGNGMLIWENVFGSWNPWSPDDAALWKRLSQVLRRVHPLLERGRWEPFVGTREGGVTVHRWSAGDWDLYLFWTPLTDRPTPRQLGLSTGAHGGWDLLADSAAASDSTPLTTASGLGALAVRRRPEARLIPQLMARQPAVVPRAVVPNSNRTVAVPSVSHPASLNGMVLVPGGTVRMRLRHERRECGCIPDPGSPPEEARRWAWGNPFQETLEHDYMVQVRPFWIDESLVTNADFDRFLSATGYRPREPRNFLKHWGGARRCPAALREHPVVYVDLDDARAYAAWSGKRLPTEAEWQLAAQGTDGRKWPWGNDFDAARCNGSGVGTTPVRAYPSGRSPFGCYDMAGNVWQWTESEQSDGHTRSCIIRGGSWFAAQGSLWYVAGGPQPLDTHTRFLLLYPGLDRCATIGFRCVRDFDTAARAGASPASSGQ